MIFFRTLFKTKGEAISFAVFVALIAIILPLALPIFRLNLVGKYLSYGFVAIGLVLLWGRCGILSLGQGVFFGLGGYCMAMFLKLEASDPVSTSIQTTPGIPDFMDWNQITQLPWFWEPFKSFTFASCAVFLLPGLIAFIIGWAMFRRRVGGVYFAIITQAIALILSLGIDGNQGFTGGRNGITDLKTLLGWDIRTTGAQYTLYFLCVFLLLASALLAKYIINTRFGRVLMAMRDREDRVRFSGYDVAMCRTFVFALAAMLSGLGGALFVLQVGFMSPSLVGIIPSIEMVIFTAVGGRLSVIGAILGCLIVNFGKTAFSEAYPDAWLYLMGGTFIAVVMFFPDGLAGILDKSGTLKAKLSTLGTGLMKKLKPAESAEKASAAVAEIPKTAEP
ncbi:urea ABC transporter permease subunit UrtC [Verrucomicrobium sp. BvORR034]|uniref:urea ABC transporter permease subunit UrtC n=1 Tax=Verrucomicrobium sp. BvORR034 TaxID=1396418 RepID=UPI000678C8B6|nr:urea ABC transporter permease subunit UrtC [Verrucomicrobium sp. BvORR034]